MKRLRTLAIVAAIAVRLLADNNPPPSQPANSVSPSFAGAGLNAPFPDSVYGADHAGSGVSLSYPYTSPFGNTDHSRGVIAYTCAPFSPRNSEGVYGMDVWLEQQDSSGNWSPASLRGGVPDQGATYQPVNTPNPGTSPSYAFTWTFDATPLPPNTSFRIFVYVYLYNQGGGNQGNFYVASSIGTVNTGAANDVPRLAWSGSFGSTNPTQVSAGQTYTISADAEDDNGNLVAVSINKNGQPFADAGGGNGFSGNSQNPTSDPAGTVTYSAWASDSDGALSPLLSWTVTVIANAPPPPGPLDQPAVGSNNASLTFGQAFLPEFFGGAGSGGWQFVVGGFTNWDGGASANTGTSQPGGGWTPSWLPPETGSYPFWVVRDGDANYTPSSAAGPYTLSVLPAPETFSATPLFFTYNGSPQGPAVSSSPASATQQVTGTTTATNAGNYSLTVAATGNYAGAATFNWFIAPASQTPVLISPPSSTITAGQSITFSASGGTSTAAYTWSGSASGTGPSNTVTFATAGNYLVTVARPGDLNTLSSNTAIAEIVVDAPSGPPTETPPTATLSANPAAGQAPLSTTLTWTTTLASSVSVVGAGVASTALSGTQAVTLSSPGTYTCILTARGPGGQVTQSATVIVSPPPPVDYTLTTIAVGNGSATPGAPIRQMPFSRSPPLPAPPRHSPAGPEAWSLRAIRWR